MALEKKTKSEINHDCNCELRRVNDSTKRWSGCRCRMRNYYTVLEIFKLFVAKSALDVCRAPEQLY